MCLNSRHDSRKKLNLRNKWDKWDFYYFWYLRKTSLNVATKTIDNRAEVTNSRGSISCWQSLFKTSDFLIKGFLIIPNKVFYGNSQLVTFYERVITGRGRWATCGNWSIEERKYYPRRKKLSADYCQFSVMLLIEGSICLFFLICFVLCKHLNCWLSNMKKHEGNKNCNTFSIILIDQVYAMSTKIMETQLDLETVQIQNQKYAQRILTLETQ